MKLIQIFKALNLFQTLLFVAALIWFFFAAPDTSGNTVLMVIGLFVVWLIFIAVVGKALHNAEKGGKPDKPGPQQISVYEFIRRTQEGIEKEQDTVS
ncbi:MAG: hypothetical protein QNI91_12555 [Arenicellales bacterium]|nr:hypothetical protein [Arenicellales bacterium]